jgi:undecaprenyl-diphosphatase
LKFAFGNSAIIKTYFMNYIDAIILGIVQGLTEFIPVSSTAHLVFASRWTGIYAGNPQQITATMAVIQLGTLAAVFVYFASDIYKISRNFLKELPIVIKSPVKAFSGATLYSPPANISLDTWLGWLIILGSLPIGTIGLLFKKAIEGEGTKNLWIISVMLIVIALLLAIAEKVGKQKRDVSKINVIDSIVIGFAQVLALMPGASRSGSTIMGGLFSGLNREAAARFSFLLSIPAITASGLLELREAIKILPHENFGPLLLATVAAGVVGYASIWFLLAFLRRNSTAIFIIYRLILGAVILLLLSNGVISPAI